MSPRQLQDRLDRQPVRRLLVIKPSAFGDVVQALPLLPVLRERFPECSIDWVINRELAGLLSGHPDIDQLICFDRRGRIGRWRSFLANLRRRRYDLVFDLQGLLRTAAMTLATRAPLRLGLESAREGSGWSCHGLLSDSGPLVPAHRRYWRVAEFLGRGDRRPRTIVTIPPSDRSWADRVLGELPSPVIALHPGARWATKRWGVGRFATVAHDAAERHDASLLLIGGPGERATCERLAGQLVDRHRAPVIRNLVGQTSLKQLAALLSSVDLLVTNDSGPMHLAAALGTPVVGLFTATSPRRSGPPGSRHVLIQSGVECAGCYHKRCPLPGRRHLGCLDELPPDRVTAAVDQVLGKRALPRVA